MRVESRRERRIGKWEGSSGGIDFKEYPQYLLERSFMQPSIIQRNNKGLKVL